jgi:adenylate cyclase
MGEQNVKNIARTVRAFEMSAAVVASTPLAPVQAPSDPDGSRPIRPPSVWAPLSPQSSSTITGTEAKPPPRLSIVVLPFANLSSDPEQEYFVDAITDDLTTDLSRIVNSFVISRTTAFAYKGEPVIIGGYKRELPAIF